MKKMYAMADDYCREVRFVITVTHEGQEYVLGLTASERPTRPSDRLSGLEGPYGYLSPDEARQFHNALGRALAQIPPENFKHGA